MQPLTNPTLYDSGRVSELLCIKAACDMTAAPATLLGNMGERHMDS